MKPRISMAIYCCSLRSAEVFLLGATGLISIGCNTTMSFGNPKNTQDAATPEPDAQASLTVDASALQVGDPCVTDSQCPRGGSGTASCMTTWPGGYCAVIDCAPHGHDCPNDPGQTSTSIVGSKCALAPTATCLELCAVDADCRAGYSCQQKSDAAQHGNVTVCMPTSPDNPGVSMDAGASDPMMADAGGMDG